ncbi:MAG TPA: type II secretion system F family protein [Thermoanaerobaculia bacterium]
MSSSLELLILVIAVGVVLFVAWKYLRSRQALQDSSTHLERLMGRDSDETEVFAEAQPKVGLVEQKLRAAGVGVSPLAAGVLLALTIAIVMLLIMRFSVGFIWAAVGGVLALWLIISLMTEFARQRAWLFENRLADAIDLMIGALAAGQTPVEAIASAAEGSLQPVKSELGEVASQLRASVPIERALTRMLVRYPSEGVRIFTQLLVAKWEVGGPLAPSLQAVTRTMRHSLRLRGQLRTHIAGAQTAAIAVALIPYLMIAFFVWKKPDALSLVWALSWGPMMFGVAILMQIAGFIWLRRILRIEL